MSSYTDLTSYWRNSWVPEGILIVIEFEHSLYKQMTDMIRRPWVKRSGLCFRWRWRECLHDDVIVSFSLRRTPRDISLLHVIFHPMNNTRRQGSKHGRKNFQFLLNPTKRYLVPLWLSMWQRRLWFSPISDSTRVIVLHSDENDNHCFCKKNW